MKVKLVLLAISCLTAAALMVESCGGGAPSTSTTTGTTSTSTTQATTVKTTAQTTQKTTATATATTTTVKTTAQTTQKTTATATATTTTAGPEVPVYGGTLSYLGHDPSSEPGTWDPIDASWNIDYFTTWYYERLMIGDINKGPRGTNQYAFSNREGIADDMAVGNLAERWEVPDSSTIIFYLRKGVRWQSKPPVNGREFVADDVVYSMMRYKNGPKIGAARLAWVKSITATDKYTVTFKLDPFYGNWAYMIGWGAFCQIVPQEVVTAGINDWRNANGTGPFIVADYVTGSSVTYRKNPDYWKTATVGGKEYKIPFSDRVISLIIPDEATRYAALRARKVDIEQIIPQREVEGFKKSNPELLSFGYPSPGTYIVFMRMDKAPFNDLRVRKALSMAVDRQGFIKSFLADKAVMLNRHVLSIDPESIYTPLEKLPPNVKENFDYNPTKAKELLAQAGYPNGFNTEMLIIQSEADYFSFVKANWAAIGVNVDLQVVDIAVRTSTFYSKNHKAMVGLWRGIPQALTEMRTYRLTSEIWNASMYDDPEYNKLYDAMMVETDTTKRLAMIKELNIILLRAQTVTILPGGYSYAYWFPWVKNYYGEAGLGYWYHGPVYAYAWIDPDVKKKY